MQFLNYIDGDWKVAASGKLINKLNPFTGESLGQICQSEPMDVILALPGLKKSQETWEKVALTEKAKIFFKLAEMFEKKIDEIAYQESLHQGLDFEFTKKNSIEFAIQALKKMAIELNSWSAQTNQKKWAKDLLD